MSTLGSRQGVTSARVVLAAAILSIATAVGFAPVNAHAELVSSTPARDSVLASAPEQVTLEFDGALSDVGANVISVVGPDGTAVDDGMPTVSGNSIEQGLFPVATIGTYTVTYRVVSADGHIVNDSFSFQYQPPAASANASDLVPTPSNSLAVSGPSATNAAGQPTSEGLRLSPLKIATIIVFAVIYFVVARWLKAYRRRSLGR